MTQRSTFGLVALCAAITLIPTILAGGSHRCVTDSECVFFQQLYETQQTFNPSSNIYEKPDGLKCCSDDQCHDNCDWEVAFVIIFFVVIPLVSLICCSVVIGLIVYCAVKQNKKSGGVVHPTAHYNSPPYPGTHQPYPAYPVPPPAYQQPPPPAAAPSQPTTSSGAAPVTTDNPKSFGFVQS